MSRILYLFIVIPFLFGCGEDVESVKVEELEVMKKDLGEMNWEDAKAACRELGDGWRLPTIAELKKLFEYRNSIGGFKKERYWSSTISDGLAATVYFGKPGNEYVYYSYEDRQSKKDTYYVRAVRDIE